MSCLPPRREKKRHVSSKELHYVVIGGGIAGVSCTQELYRLGHRNITLISSKEMLKEVLDFFFILLFMLFEYFSLIDQEYNENYKSFGRIYCF